MSDLNLLFEIVNGSTTIMLSFMVVFLVIFLYERSSETSDRDKGFTDRLRGFVVWLRMPEQIGLQLAIAITIADFGHLGVRASTWIWRETTKGGEMPSPIFAAIIGFGAISGIGILCKLRVVSLARYGHAPWVCAMAVAIAFIIYKLA